VMNAAQAKLCLKYRLLNTMGIPIWIEKKSSALISYQPMLGAAVLVLLPEKILETAKEHQKILAGMLKVLELNEEELCVAWLNPLKETEEVALMQTINQWAPYRVLVLGESLAQFLLKSTKSLDELRLNSHIMAGYIPLIEVTYHPVELEKSIEYKRKAYQDLLRLKSQIIEARMV